MKPRTSDTFTTWFNRLGLKHFTAAEVSSYFTVDRRGAKNTPPPKRLWPNIIPALQLADKIRAHFNAPCVILSSYRNPAYNRRCGGVSNSQHLQFRALDIAVAGVSPKAVYTALLTLRQRKLWTGGLGLYSTFVHIDTRGYNANW